MKHCVTCLTAVVLVLGVAQTVGADNAAPAERELRSPAFLDYVQSRRVNGDVWLNGSVYYNPLEDGSVTLHGLIKEQGILDPAGFDSILELIQRKGGLRSHFKILPANLKASSGFDRGAFELRISENQQLVQAMQARAEAGFNHFKTNFQPWQATLGPQVQESEAQLRQLEQESQRSSTEAIEGFERSIAELESRTRGKQAEIDAAAEENVERLEHARLKADELSAKSEIRLVELRAKLVDLQAKAELRRQETQSRQESLHAKLASEPVTARIASPELGSTDESTLSWDEWYARLADKVRKPLIQALNNHGNPAGENTVRITVWNDHRLSVVIERSSNREFDGAIVDAYTSIDLDPELEFPAGSRRSVVSFLTDHLHAIGTPPSQLTARKITGDDEVVRTP